MESPQPSSTAHEPVDETHFKRVDASNEAPAVRTEAPEVGAAVPTVVVSSSAADTISVRVVLGGSSRRVRRLRGTL